MFGGNTISRGSFIATLVTLAAAVVPATALAGSDGGEETDRSKWAARADAAQADRSAGNSGVSTTYEATSEPSAGTTGVDEGPAIGGSVGERLLLESVIGFGAAIVGGAGGGILGLGFGTPFMGVGFGILTVQTAAVPGMARMVYDGGEGSGAFVGTAIGSVAGMVGGTLISIESLNGPGGNTELGMAAGLMAVAVGPAIGFEVGRLWDDPQPSQRADRTGVRLQPTAMVRGDGATVGLDVKY